MEAGDAVWTGSAQTAQENWQGHPGLERPQKEGRDRDKDRDKECRVC